VPVQRWHLKDAVSSQSACNSKVGRSCFTSRLTSLSIVVDGTSVSSRTDTTINDEGISILPAIRCRKKHTMSRQQGRSNDDTQQSTTRHKTVCFGSRSVRGSSAFGRRVLACSSATILGWSVIVATILFSYRLELPSSIVAFGIILYRLVLCII
jgi:hypothetical protein